MQTWGQASRFSRILAEWTVISAPAAEWNSPEAVMTASGLRFSLNVDTRK